MITHDLDLATDADRILVLDEDAWWSQAPTTGSSPATASTPPSSTHTPAPQRLPTLAHLSSSHRR